MITTDDLRRACVLVREVVPRTPTYRWPLLCDAVGTEVWVKHENHTPAGAFKIRGGLVFVDRLRRRKPDATGLVVATRGNHGQSLALAGTSAGLEVTVVVPRGNSADKNAAMQGFGATVIEHGDDFQDAREHAQRLAAEKRLESVPSFHPDLVLGVATYARELFEDSPLLDTVYVPVGMGSGICALLAARDLLSPSTEIVGVVSERADAVARSVAAGSVVPTATAATFVDGVATRTPDEQAVARMIAGRARIVTVSEDGAAEAMRLMYRTTHNLPEPAGSLALAGLCADGERVHGRRVAVVHTGGNVDAPVLAEVLAGRTPAA